MLAAAVALTPMVAFADEAPQQAQAIVSPDRAQDGEVMNYAVVLTETGSEDNINTLKTFAEEHGDKALMTYPHLHAFFVQSARKSFSREIADYAAAQGIALHSVGPTRHRVIAPGDEELVVTTANPPAGGARARKELEEFQPDPKVATTWGLTAIGAIEAAKVDVPRADVLVGVLDTGVDFTHPELADQVALDKSVSCGNNGIPDTNPDAFNDVHYHGTHVAGTIAAAHNGVGIDSVAPSVKIAAVRTSDEEGFFYPEYVVCAFDWAVSHDFDITNNSYYMDPWSFWMPNEANQAAGYEVVRRAVAYSQENGVLNVSAAGNEDYDIDNPTTESTSPSDAQTEEEYILDRDIRGGIDVPNMLPGMVRVTAVARKSFRDDPATSNFKRSYFSNYGESLITVAAPGSSIYSTTPQNGFRTLDGTSMASPHAAGVLALLKSVHPEASSDQLVELLTTQAAELYPRLEAPTDGKEYRGAGLVNALAAVTKNQPQPGLGVLQYSTDGQTWYDVPEVDGKLQLDAGINPSAQFRIAATGPATKVSVTVADATPASADSDNPWGEDLTLTTDKVDLAAAYEAAHELNIAVKAEGRNKDERADDDVMAHYAVTLVLTPEVHKVADQDLVLELPIADIPQSDSPQSESVAPPASKQSSAPAKVVMASTGATTVLLLALVIGLALAGATILALNKKNA